MITLFYLFVKSGKLFYQLYRLRALYIEPAYLTSAELCFESHARPIQIPQCSAVLKREEDFAQIGKL